VVLATPHALAQVCGAAPRVVPATAELGRAFVRLTICDDGGGAASSATQR
jgi:hypothetical protein